VQPTLKYLIAKKFLWILTSFDELAIFCMPTGSKKGEKKVRCIFRNHSDVHLLSGEYN